MAEVAFYEYSHMSVILEKSFRMPKDCAEGKLMCQLLLQRCDILLDINYTIGWQL